MILSSLHRILLNLILFSFPLLAAYPLCSQSLEMLKTEREQSEKEMEMLQKQLKSIEGNQKAGLQELTLLKKKIDSRKQILKTIDKQISKLSWEIDEKHKSISTLQNDLKNVQNTYADLLVRYYNIRGKDDWLMYILASESINQAYKRMQYFREILYLLQAQANEITALTDRLNEEITDVARKQELLQNNIDDKLKEVTILESEEKHSRTVLTDLKRRENEIRKQLDEKQKSFNELSKGLTEFFRNEVERGMDISTGDMKLLTEMFEANKGFLPWPTMGTIVSNFGKHNHPVYKELRLPDNNGIDIQTAKNAEVYAVFSGIVAQIVEYPQTGEKNLVIRHGAYTSIYFKVDKIFVKVGDSVKARQKIATVAATSEGSVLHFEIRKSNTAGANQPLNPESWILK